jgi:hypothetical protein
MSEIVIEITTYDARGEITGTRSYSPLEYEALQTALPPHMAGSYSSKEFYVIKGAAKPFPPRPSSGHSWNWDTKKWALSDAAVDDLIDNALDAVDKAAGKARLRYQTLVPGQEATYAAKEDEARTWQAAEFAGEAPPYISAESKALRLDPKAFALRVIAAADAWHTVTGPAIEANRAKWKSAIRNSNRNPAVIDSQRDLGVSTLNRL